MTRFLSSLGALAVILSGCSGAAPVAPPTASAAPTTVAEMCQRLEAGLSGRPAGLSQFASPEVLAALDDWGDGGQFGTWDSASTFANTSAMLCVYAAGDAELRVAVERRGPGGALFATRTADAVSSEYADPEAAITGLWAHETDGTRIRILANDDGYEYVRTFTGGGAPVRGRVMLIDACDGGTATLYGSLLIDFGDRELCYRIDRLEPGRSMSYTLEENGVQWAWTWEAP